MTHIRTIKTECTHIFKHLNSHHPSRILKSVDINCSPAACTKCCRNDQRPDNGVASPHTSGDLTVQKMPNVKKTLLLITQKIDVLCHSQAVLFIPDFQFMFIYILGAACSQNSGLSGDVIEICRYHKVQEAILEVLTFQYNVMESVLKAVTVQ